MVRERTNNCIRLYAIIAWYFASALLFNASQLRGAYQTIIETGPNQNRVDLVFLGDGYTAADIADGTYAAHIDGVLDYVFNYTEDPFPRYRNFFNVYRIDVISNESGSDVPPEGIYRDTALDGSYYFNGGPERLLYLSESKTTGAIMSELSAGAPFALNEMRLVTVNETRYGGGGGQYAVFAGGNSKAYDLALHETGHAFGRLADEYYYSDGRYYPGSEPVQANVTTVSDPGAVKWSNWIGYVDPDHPDIGPIGVYEGAKFYEYGLYRPSENSKMRSLGTPFNAVSREQLILQFYKYVDPLDDWLTNDAEPVNGDDLWVKVVDPDVIDVRWLVDDIPLAGATGQTLRLSDYGFGPGDYQVEALAYDNLIGDWIRRDLDSVRQSVSWNVHIAPIERLMGDASLDGYVNEDDLNLMLTGWGQQADWGYGDFSGDGFVDDDDLNLILVAWNQEAIPGAHSTVPEPTASILLVLVGPWLFRRSKPRSTKR